MDEPKISSKLNGKTIVRVLPAVEFQWIDQDTDSDYAITMGDIIIELNDGSFLRFWTSEWGGIEHSYSLAALEK